VPYEKELEVARSAAMQASQLALRHQRAGLKQKDKPDGSPVTLADQECERLIAGLLEQAFPLDGLIGEEGARKESRSGRRWIVDPIDGTRDFIRRDPLWAVLIAVESGGESLAGVTHLPMLGQLYFAARGAGAWRNDEPIHVSSIDKPESAVLCMNGLNRMGQEPFGGRLISWMERFWSVRSMGGAADAMMVAAGEADLWIERKAEIWDLAPLQVIVEEAGGRFCDFRGRRGIAGGNGIACTPGLEPAIKEFLGLPSS
jgi:histidinol phosphatase-like enzyme (inositol monophosphatase family)